MIEYLSELPAWQRIVVALALAAAAHVFVRVVRALSARAMSSGVARRSTKTRTLISLFTSTLVFALYFAAIGYVLNEAGVPLSTYLASASIIGLAVAFGSQGLVQDVVSGVTIVFTDLFDIGDVIEVSGQVGLVERFGMRFTVLRNPMGAEVFVPNRSILNVVTYPRGYVRCFIDITLPDDPALAEPIEQKAIDMANGALDLYPGIFRAPPEVMPRQTTRAGRQFQRIKFRIWPGRNATLEGAFRQEMLQMARTIDPAYQDWMITVNVEVERHSPPTPGRRNPA